MEISSRVINSLPKTISKAPVGAIKNVVRWEL